MATNFIDIRQLYGNNQRYNMSVANFKLPKIIGYEGDRIKNPISLSSAEHYQVLCVNGVISVPKAYSFVYMTDGWLTSPTDWVKLKFYYGYGTEEEVLTNGKYDETILTKELPANSFEIKRIYDELSRYDGGIGAFGISNSEFNKPFRVFVNLALRNADGDYIEFDLTDSNSNKATVGITWEFLNNEHQGTFNSID